MIRKLAFLGFVLSGNLAFGTAIYTLSGTFSGSTIDTELLTPGAPFSTTFSIDEPAAPYNWSSNQTNLAVNLSYVLDGTALTTFFPGVTMWTSGAGGGFSL